MSQVFITADSLKPSNHLVEQSYSYGPGPSYTLTQTLIDSLTDAQQASILAAATFGVWKYGTAVYISLVTQQAPNRELRIFTSSDDGATWTELDTGSGPSFQWATGFFDGNHTFYCAFRANNTAAGAINLQNFDLATGLWGAVYGTSGAPTADGTGIAVYLRESNNTLLVLYGNRNSFNAPDPSGVGGVSFDLTALTWGVPFDVGAALLALPGWDATQTTCPAAQLTSYIDASDNVGVFFRTNSVQTSPVIWGNRAFYQQILPDDSLGSFEDFPNQDVAVSGKQDLEVFTGSPMGRPVLLVDQDMIVLPVSMNNRIQGFPLQLPNVYLGTPISAPVWSINLNVTLDPEALVDTTIYAESAPAAAFDGQRIYAVWSAQDSDGQNQARLRLGFTSNLVAPDQDWSAQTIYDLQVDAAPGFNFSQQILAAPSISIPAAVDTCTVLWWF